MDETSIPVFSIFACIREERIAGAKDLCYAVENTASAGAFSTPFHCHLGSTFMKIALQFAMPEELRALPGAEDLAPMKTISGVPLLKLPPAFPPA